MNKLSEHSPALTFSTASVSDPQPVRRLIVLVPTDTDYTAAARKIQEVANAFKSRIQLLSLCKDMTQESSLRRQLVTLSALVRDGKLHVEIRVEIGTNWVGAVNSDLQDGDVIVCFEGQREGLWQKPLSQILESKLRVPVYVLTDVNIQNRQRPDWLSQSGAWTGSLGIIAGLAWLQFHIATLPKDWAQTTLLIISIMVEAWLIWFWNSLLG